METAYGCPLGRDYSLLELAAEAEGIVDIRLCKGHEGTVIARLLHSGISSAICRHQKGVQWIRLWKPNGKRAAQLLQVVEYSGLIE